MLAVLLAAGRGRRLGGPKALADLGGETFVERCARALLGGGADALRVVVADEAVADEVRRRVPAAEVLRAPDADRRGQTGSIQAGLAPGLGRHDAFLLHTVDHPLVEGATVRRLAEAWEARAPGIAVVAPAWEGRRGHPCVFHGDLAAAFLDLAPGTPGHAVIRADASRVHHLEVDTPWVVRDIDTPEDLERARATL